MCTNEENLPVKMTISWETESSYEMNFLVKLSNCFHAFYFNAVGEGIRRCLLFRAFVV